MLQKSYQRKKKKNKTETGRKAGKSFMLRVLYYRENEVHTHKIMAVLCLVLILQLHAEEAHRRLLI